jgi:aerobic-type carbon monoxide dehydrogenase small subunit (CoxS/CutS family)
MGTYTLRVNGRNQTVESWDPNQPLLYVLRDEMGLHGPKFGCGLAVRRVHSPDGRSSCAIVPHTGQQSGRPVDHNA